MRYGAKYAYWAPFEGDEPTDGSMPTYGTASEFGGINESNDTLTFADASAYADNLRKIYISEFTSGEISTKALYRDGTLTASIFGMGTDDDSGLSYSSTDDPPYGGYGFISNRMDANKDRYYEVVFYPKVQAKPASSNYKTKEDGITLEYEELTFAIFECNAEVYKVIKDFDTEDEAKSYLDGLFTGESAVPGVETTTEETEE